MTIRHPEAFALCASSFAAPVVQGFGTVLLGVLFSPDHASFSSIVFWKCVWALAWLPGYLAVSLPLAWLVWRYFPVTLGQSWRYVFGLLSLLIPVVWDARFFGLDKLMPVEPEFLGFALGVALNLVIFLRLQISSQPRIPERRLHSEKDLRA